MPASIPARQPKGASYNLSCTCQPAPQIGTVKITKVSSGGTGTFAFTSSETTVINPGLTPFNTSPGGSASETFSNVPAGPISITENDPSAAGFDLTSISCGTGSTDLGARKASFTLTTGSTVECTFTNTKKSTVGGTITIVKQVVGTDKSFSFSGGLGSFNLSNGGSHPSGPLAAGSYVVTETVDPNYTLDSNRLRW